jgi:cytochrome oxidase assembly protein ShyY1
MEMMQIKFLVLIILVFIITVGFCVLIWQQTKHFEKKALAAKQRQKEYEEVLRLKMKAEKREKRAQMESQVEKSEES